MDISQIDETKFVDIFGDPDAQNKPELIIPRFGQTEEIGNVDIFANTTTLVPTTDETTTISLTDETTTLAPKDVDIFEDKTKNVRKNKYAFEDATGYFADRIKSGKFVAIEEDVAGEVKPFIPKTPEEFDEFIDIQVNTQLDNRKKELEEGWYENKSSAWKAVAKYSEMVDSPEEMLPFLQGVGRIESVKDLDENDLDAAEKIIRIRLGRRGESEDVIDDQVDSLKTTDKLVSTATKYKPLLIQEETQYLQGMIKQKQAEDVKYNQLIENIRTNTIKAIEAPIFGKQKLKRDEQSVVFDLIGVPSLETGGYGIYNKIDSLFEEGKFETLTKIALLLEKEESFINYISNVASDKTAVDLQKKLRVANENRSSSNDDVPEEEKRVIQRNQFTSRQAKFGR